MGTQKTTAQSKVHAAQTKLPSASTIGIRKESTKTAFEQAAIQHAKDLHHGRKEMTNVEMLARSYEKTKLWAIEERYTIPKEIHLKVEGLLKNPELEKGEALRVELMKTLYVQQMTMQKYLYSEKELAGFIKELEGITTEKELDKSNNDWMRWLIKKHGHRIGNDDKDFELFKEKLMQEDEEYTKEEWFWTYMFEVVNNGGISQTVSVPKIERRLTRLLRQKPQKTKRSKDGKKATDGIRRK